MSLRWRLALSSVAVLAVLFTIFATAAYFTLQKTLYDPIDASLKKQTDAQLISVARFSTFYPIPNQIFGSASFMFYDPSGKPHGDESRAVPVNDWLLNKAMSGQDAWTYALLPTG